MISRQRHYNLIQGGPKKKSLPNCRRIVLKPVIEIRFVHQIKVWIKQYDIIRWH